MNTQTLPDVVSVTITSNANHIIHTLCDSCDAAYCGEPKKFPLLPKGTGTCPMCKAEKDFGHIHRKG